MSAPPTGTPSALRFGRAWTLDRHVRWGRGEGQRAVASRNSLRRSSKKQRSVRPPRLRTHPGVGGLTALAFALIIWKAECLLKNPVHIGMRSADRYFSTNLQTGPSIGISVVLDELSVFLSRQRVVKRLEECIVADEASGVFLPRIQNLCLPHLVQRFTLF